jgi:hypothetical protein
MEPFDGWYKTDPIIREFFICCGVFVTYLSRINDKG